MSISHFGYDQMIEETPVYADGTAAYDESIHWLYAPGARYQKGQLHYVVSDHMGTPRELLTEQGKVAWAGRLSTWGEVTEWPVAANDADKLSCNLRFAGQYADEESGLHYNRFRYYDNETGQYLSPDPIGLAGGVNPYGYVHNPLGWVDPLGLACCPPTAQQLRDMEALRNGQDVTVRSAEDARKLLDYMSELRPHVDNFPANSGYLFKDTAFGDVWKQPKGTYRGDLYNTKNPLSDTVHDSNNILHDTNPHYNILFPDGTKAGIIITP